MIILLVVFALLMANALFVAAEFAVVAAPRTAVEHQARQGNRAAQRLLRILVSPVAQDRYIATAQLGITLASVGLGMYGEYKLAAWLEPRLGWTGVARAISAHAAASTAAIVVLTFFHILIGEMVPKALALSHAEATARVVLWPMRVCLAGFYPFVLVLNGVGNACLKLIGIRRQPNVQAQAYTAEELQLIVDESAEQGVLRAESGRILRELFEFSDLTAAQVMVPRVRIVGIPLGATPDTLRELLARSSHTRYPVFDRDLDHIVGMLHVKDLLRKLLFNEPVAPAEGRAMPVVPATAPVDDVLAAMQRANAHMAVVIDEHGGTAGLISLEDLFEEVVGEIDEGAATPPAISANPDGSVRAAGTVRLDELGQYLDLDLEHEEVDSLSGLVLARLGRPPFKGDVVEYGRLRLEVTATSGRGVREVRVSMLPDST